MKTKLILNVGKKVIDQVKEYAKSHKSSISRLIESYLFSLISPNKTAIEITPLVKSLSGVKKLRADFNYQDSNIDFLMK